MIGKKVEHKKYGYGIVKQIRNKGFYLLIEFENGLSKWVPQNEVIFIEKTSQEIQKHSKEIKFEIGDIVKHHRFGKGEVKFIKPYVFNKEETYLLEVYFENYGLKSLIQSIAQLEKISEVNSETKFRSRKIIEALRLGIVPYDCVEEFTFGRDNEISQIKNWLDNQNQNLILIIGEYGAGKTHLLHYTISYALKNNFAVAWVEIDPNETPFHKPKRVYRNLVQNFRYLTNKQIKTFRDFLSEILIKYNFEDNFYLKYLPHAKKEDFWTWIEGADYIRPVEMVENYWGYWENKYKYIPGLYDTGTAANIYCYLLSTYGWAAKEILRLNGLILMFDEAESLDLSFKFSHHLKSSNFLKALIGISKNDKNLTINPSFSGLEYSKVGKSRDIPFIYKTPTFLKLLFAFASSSENLEIDINEFDEAFKIYIEPLDYLTLKNIFNYIVNTYCEAYDLSKNKLNIFSLFKELNFNLREKNKIRFFVKAAIEILDLIRFKMKRS